jgi:hypothetical protein
MSPRDARPRQLAPGPPKVGLITLRVLDTSPWDPTLLRDLPPITAKFSEPNVFSRALAALGPIGHAVPITFVVDCRAKLRWHHDGELTASALDQLNSTLQELQAEPIDCPARPRASSKRLRFLPTGDSDTDDMSSTTGDSEYTTNTPQPTDSAAPPPDEYLTPRPTSSTCGDGRCRAQRGENCYTCPDDCGCKKGYHCAATTSAESQGEAWQCEPNNDVNNLRD